MQHKQMSVKIDKVKNLERNARKHSPAQIQQIEESIKRFGFLSPIVIDENNVCVAGNGRLEAARKLGLTEVPAIRAGGLPPDELRAYALVDNRLSETSEWDPAILKEELDDLMIKLDMDLECVGFAPDEIESLVGKLVTPIDIDDEKPPKEKEMMELHCPKCGFTFEVKK